MAAEPTVPAVSMKHIVVSFGGVRVLKGVDFEVMPGEVHALLGENGAGKSTLMKVLEGVYRPDAGEIEIGGVIANESGDYDPAAHGVTMVFQEFSLIPTLTIAQNILLGREPRTKVGLIDEAETQRIAGHYLELMKADIDVKQEIGSLPASSWQLTEIAKALSKDPGVLVLDEPTASLTRDETEALFAQIRSLKDRGIAIVYISHRMAEIYDIADRITVLRNGERVKTARVSEYPVREVIADMLGNRDGEVAEPSPPTTRNSVTGDVVLSLRGVSSRNGISDIDLNVCAGEIVGLAGLMGSGRSELARAIFGIDPVVSGTIAIDGQPVKISRPRDAVRAGIALVPEDRRAEGLVLEHSVQTNAELPLITRDRRWWIGSELTRKLAKDVVGRLDVRTSSLGKQIGLLSGGNQQKVVIGKWLLTNPRLFILDEPTAGIDIGAKREIMRMLRSYAATGCAVLFISSELEELLQVSDRIVVLRGGRVDPEYAGRTFPTEEALHRAVQGV